MEPYNDRYEIRRMLSPDAADTFADQSLDSVYLDANPSYASSCVDLAAWWPKVKGGGVLCGHDFLDGELLQGSFGVKPAVEEFEKLHGVEAAATLEQHWPSCYVIKPDNDERREQLR